jgi:hypothetical protein
MKIKKYIQFINEISGTEIPQKAQGSYFGPAYGDTVSPNTINKSHTGLKQIHNFQNPDSKNDLTSDLFFGDDYNSILMLGHHLKRDLAIVSFACYLHIGYVLKQGLDAVSYDLVVVYQQEGDRL